MAKIRIDFQECIQNAQELGIGDEEYMWSRMFFFINVNGRRVNDLYHADIKQTVGGEYEQVPIEVGPPCNDKGKRYDGPPWNSQAYRDEVEKAYRRLVGSGGSAIRIGGRGKMEMNRLGMGYSVEFEAEDAM